MPEKVIFRREYDPYMKIEKYLACFPDDEALYGRIAYVPIFFNRDFPFHDCYGEMTYEYFYSKPIIHKDDPIIPKLVDALEYFYGGEYRVMERVMR